MRSRPWLLAGVALAAACGDAFTPDTIASPDGVTAQAISMTAVAVEWNTIPGTEVAGYRVERRENLQGDFKPVAEGNVSLPYFDTDLTPDTYYGYRIRTLTKLGEVSGPSVVAGARTPPPPGIVVETQTLGRGIDADGYTSVLHGPADSVWASIGPSDARRFSPLVPGSYAVDLRGVAGNCAVVGATTHNTDVTDQGLNTVTIVHYEVRCRDPRMGRITSTLTVDGDSLDADGYLVRLTGLADSSQLPDSLRIVSRQQHFPAGGGTYAFEDLPPGDYELQLQDLAGQCTAAGATQRDLHVAALGDALVGYAIHCPKGDPNTGSRPFVLRNQLTPDPVALGGKVTLAMTLDLSAVPGTSVSAAQGELRYDQTAFRFDSAKAGALDQFGANGATPGVVVWLGLTTGAPPTGVVAAGRIYFTAVGAAGASSATRTTNLLIVAGDGATQIDTLVRVVEDTVTIGGGGGGTNQAPVAHANGPYSGAAEAPIGFNATGSNDPDGSVASYAWTFGDGATASGASVTHAYTTAGTYTATLTVTDNLGAASSDAASVTVTSSGPSAPFTWRGQFGAVNPVDSVVALTVTLDLNADIPETPGPEALATFAVDSLKWDPTVLRYYAFNWGPGGAGTVYTTDTDAGKISFSSFTLPASNNSGLITAVTIRFKVIGAPGRVTTSATRVGTLIGTPATGGYDYRSRTGIVEAALTAP